MKKSMLLTLSGQELMELQRIILDEDKEEALRFMQKHLKDKACPSPAHHSGNRSPPHLAGIVQPTGRGHC